MDGASSSDRRSPLHALHVELGAKLVPFGGWEMPLSYPSGTIAEHLACREDAVLFDVSHLGTVRVQGPGSLEQLQLALSNDLGKVSPGRAQYTHLLNDRGGVEDDIIVWWVGEDRFDVMPNASNTDRVVAAIGGKDVTAERAVIAVQGPKARAKLADLYPELAQLGRFRVAELHIEDAPAVAAGTGYTGEDGVEVAVEPEAAARFVRKLVDAGVVPAGLGARDTLRLEAGLPLHGHELGPEITPLMARLGWVVGWDKAAFRGRDALLAERDSGPAKLLVGVSAEGRQPLREGSEVAVAGSTVGTLTSGNLSPMLGHAIGMGFIDASHAVAGTELTLTTRGRERSGSVVDLPFWKARS